MKTFYFLFGACYFARFLAGLGHEAGWWVVESAVNTTPSGMILLYGMCSLLWFDKWLRGENKNE